MIKIGRNEPCRCGSGKKYKKCCMMKERARQHQEVAAHAHQGAAAKAIQWLERRYHNDVDEWLSDVWFDSIDPEGWGEVPANVAESLQINAMEKMLAEGCYENDFGDDIAFMDLVLGKGGPLMSVEQRQYLQAMQQAPLRLWEVSEVVPGECVTLTDCFDNTCKRKIQERTASRQLKQWDVIGARPLQVPAGHWELSGSLYHFPRLKVEALKQYLVECLEGVPQDQQAASLSNILTCDWLQSVLNPQPFMPQMMDAASGEAMMLITEYYCVKDWVTLKDVLNSATDVKDEGGQGWTRFQQLDDDSYRVLATITISGKKDRIELFTRSIKSADEQKMWLEGLAGDAVRHLTRELGDPLSLLSHSDGEKSAPSPEIPDDVKKQLVHEFKRKHYTGWSDASLPALDGKTPREAVATEVGKRTVVSLLKNFENIEAGDEYPFDFGFLWQDLGLQRS